MNDSPRAEDFWKPATSQNNMVLHEKWAIGKVPEPDEEGLL